MSADGAGSVDKELADRAWALAQQLGTDPHPGG